MVGACAVNTSPEDDAGGLDQGLSACSSVHVTKNTYSGSEYWGTLSFTSPTALTAPSVSFKVPSGVTCTHDYDPTGWTHTQSGTTCTYKAGSSVKVSANKTYTINYSTDSGSSFTAQSVVVSSASCGGSTTSSSSSSSTGSTTTSSSSSSSSSGSTSSGGLFADCSKEKGCVADCSPPANDPLATGNPSYDLYDGCLLAAMEVAGLTDVWMGQLLKAQALNESGITPSIEKSTNGPCGGQNCGPWAISAGSVSGDSPPGPCGSSSKDPATGSVDYSHSYGLFQSTPACEGTFLTPTLPPGVTCTATTEANDIPFATGVDRFYCESATSLGVTDLTGNNVKGYINAWQDTSSPLYATSVFNPAYQIYMYISYTWKYNFIAANADAKGCSTYQQWYLSLAYWLTGNPTTSCTLSGSGLSYAKEALSNYQMLYGKAWPYPGP